MTDENCDDSSGIEPDHINEKRGSIHFYDSSGIEPDHIDENHDTINCDNSSELEPDQIYDNHDTTNFDDSSGIEPDHIHENHHTVNGYPTCIICNGIVKNVCNGLCGCKYCWECIEDYLDGNQKCCPGEFDECGEQLLRIDGNILVFESSQSKISRIVLKCHDQTSRFSDEIINMRNNLLNSESESTTCPYSKLGCPESQSNGGDIDEHLNIQNYSHTRLLMQWIDSMRSEMKTMKSDIVSSRKENNDLRKEIDRMKLDNDKKQAVISNLLIKDHIKSRQIEYLMNQSGCTPIACNGITPLAACEPSSQLDDIDEPEYETDIVSVRPDIYKTIEFINEKVDIVDRRITKLETNQEKQNYGEFVWVIKRFSEKIQKARKAVTREIYSESFFTHRNGYKMCLWVYPSGISMGRGSHLAIYFCILEGPYDDILQWPMKHSVTFSLINQESGLIHKSRTARFEDIPDNFAWNKPSHDKTNGFGYHKFISMDEILTNDELCRNDQIFIICSVDTSL